MALWSQRDWSEWLEAYSMSHRHPWNQHCHLVGIPLILLSLPLLALAPWLTPAAAAGLGLFALGWMFQFIGHIFERKWPEFFHDWRFLFVGTRWWWIKMRRLLDGR